MTRPAAPIGTVQARAYTVPTDQPEQDGTLDWDTTTLIVATVQAAGREGIGYTYAGKGNAGLISGNSPRRSRVRTRSTSRAALR